MSSYSGLWKVERNFWNTLCLMLFSGATLFPLQESYLVCSHKSEMLSFLEGAWIYVKYDWHKKKLSFCFFLLCRRRKMSTGKKSYEKATAVVSLLMYGFRCGTKLVEILHVKMRSSTFTLSLCRVSLIYIFCSFLITFLACCL